MTQPRASADEERHRATYRRLLKVQGFWSLMASSLFTRTAYQMSTVGVVLFALQRYRSATIAGVSIVVLILPGLVVSPISGALLDSHRRKRLMRIDFVVAASSMTAIVLLAITNNLPVGGLILLLALGSLTNALSGAGARTLVPLIVPRDLWDRANAADSLCFGTSSILGPALAGGLIAAVGSEGAMAGAALGYVAGALALAGVPEPNHIRKVSAGILIESWRGLCYVMGDRALRWIAVSVFIVNVGWGIIIIALPVVVFRLHGNAVQVGGLLALEGLVGVPATLLAGRVNTDGRERQIIAVLAAIIGAATLLLLLPSIPAIALGCCVIGAADGPANVTIFSLRQRRTAQSWFGRAFAISIALSFAGVPFGTAASGPILGISDSLAVVVAAALAFLGAALMMIKIPRTS